MQCTMYELWGPRDVQCMIAHTHMYKYIYDMHRAIEEAMPK